MRVTLVDERHSKQDLSNDGSVLIHKDVKEMGGMNTGTVYVPSSAQKL